MFLLFQSSVFLRTVQQARFKLFNHTKKVRGSDEGNETSISVKFWEFSQLCLKFQHISQLSINYTDFGSWPLEKNTIFSVDS